MSNWKFVENDKSLLAIQLTEETKYPGLIFTVDPSNIQISEPAPDGQTRVAFQWEIINDAGFSVNEESVEQELVDIIANIMIEMIDSAMKMDSEAYSLLDSSRTDVIQ
jgi:hypothetical protein